MERRQIYFRKAESAAVTISQQSLLEMIKRCLSNAPYLRPPASELLMKLEKLKELEISDNGINALRGLEVARLAATNEVKDMKKRIGHLEVSS